MPPAFRRLRVLGAAAMAIGLCFTATSCFFSGKAGKTTCSEYQSLDFTEQSELREDLLREHDLDPYFYDNIAGVEESINNFCSSSSNADRPLEDVTDWESSRW